MKMKEIEEESATTNTTEVTINGETENEYQCTRLVKKIELDLDKIIEPNYDRPSRRSIYRVPDVLRQLNEEDYTPHTISIGPFHYRSPKLQSMEDYKLKCLHNLMKRAYIKLKDLVSSIKDMEQSVRECYAETIKIDSDDFMKMIFMDACFIIEFFLRRWRLEYLSLDVRDFVELKPWLKYWIMKDLILLENQLPFFVIEKLYELLVLPLHQSYPSKFPSSFLKLTLFQFKNINPQGKLPGDPDLNKIMHFRDLIRYFYLRPPYQRLRETRSGRVVKEKYYCASQLAEAGLKFQASSSKCPLDIKYNNGVLEIPPFKLSDKRMIRSRNLIALEQCHYSGEEYVTDYFRLLDSLISTGKDVDILVLKKIIKKDPSTNIRPTVHGNFCAGILYSYANKDYYDLARKLVDFHNKHFTMMKASLRRDYSRTPWVGAATVGSIILLILTLIQTVCSVISILKI